MAYLRVHSLAVDSYLARSVLYTWAISGTSGSSGFGSVSMEQIESRTAVTETTRQSPVQSGPGRQAGRTKPRRRCGSLTFGNGQGRAPLVPENVEADAAI